MKQASNSHNVSIGCLRQAALEGHPDLQLYRAGLYWESCRDQAGRAVNLRRVRALAAVCKGFPVMILPDEWIVGVGMGEEHGH